MVLQNWFDGISLIGQFNWFRTGCWLLSHRDEAAILEMPPSGWNERDAAAAAQEALRGLPSLRVKYLICTHSHPDHFSRRTFRRLRSAFPQADPCLQRGFSLRRRDEPGVIRFDNMLRLELGGEALLLVHAPKHSATDTMVIFRGVACTGDWELGTIRSVHDWTRIWAVPTSVKLASIDLMERFPVEQNYAIHSVFSVHANDKRECLDFRQLMASTRDG